jgi:iron complex outermembrane receptor protein
LDIHPSTLPWFDLNATLSMVDGGLQDVPDSLKYLPFVPPMRITADFKYHIKKIGNGIKNAYIKFGVMNVSQQNHIYEQSAVYDGLDPAATPFEYAASKAAAAGYTLFNAGIGGDIQSRGHKFCEVYIVCNNLFDTAYMDYMSRFKYLPVNVATDRVGVFNMGRNVSFKVIIPFDFKKS